MLAKVVLQEERAKLEVRFGWYTVLNETGTIRSRFSGDERFVTRLQVIMSTYIPPAEEYDRLIEEIALLIAEEDPIVRQYDELSVAEEEALQAKIAEYEASQQHNVDDLQTMSDI